MLLFEAFEMGFEIGVGMVDCNDELREVSEFELG